MKPLLFLLLCAPALQDDSLPPRLKKAFPGIEDRLASGDLHEWTDAFREACKAWLAKRGVERTDLEPLAARGVKGARGSTERLEVCHLVLYYEFRTALPALVPLLDDPDPNVGIDVGHAFQSMATLEDLSLLWEMAGDKTGRAVGLAHAVLARLKVADVLPALRGALLDKHGGYSATTVGRLGNLGTKDAITELYRVLHTLELARVQGDVMVDNPLIFQSVFVGLGRAGAKEAIPRIAPYLTDRESLVRSGAVEALRLLGARDQAKGLVAALDDPKLQGAAVRAVGELGIAEAFPKLSEIAGRNDARTFEAVFEALVATGGKNAVPLLVPQLKHEDKYRRMAAARWLCEVGSREAVPYLLDQSYGYFWLNALRKPELWTRLKAIRQDCRIVSTEQRVIGRLASLLKLPLEAPEGVLGEFRRGSGSRDRNRPEPILYLLGGLLPHGGAEAVLEEDRIGILSKEDARAFWREWAAK